MSPWVATRLALWCFMILMTVVSYFENFVPQEVTIEGESTLIPSLEGDLEVRFAINERMHTTAYNRMWYRSPQDWPNGNAILYLNLFESLWFWKFHVQHWANILNAFDFRQVLCQHKFVVWSHSTVKPKTWKPAWFELERHQYHSSLVVSNDEMTRWWHIFWNISFLRYWTD